MLILEQSQFMTTLYLKKHLIEDYYMIFEWFKKYLQGVSDIENMCIIGNLSIIFTLISLIVIDVFSSRKYQVISENGTSEVWSMQRLIKYNDLYIIMEIFSWKVTEINLNDTTT